MGLVPMSSSWMIFRNNAWALLLLLLFASLGSGVSAVNYTVADDYGWRRPPASNPAFFSDWSAKYTFYVSDRLYFNSMGTNSNVLLVSQASYAVCNTSDPRRRNTYETPLTASFANSGVYYFTSSTPGDCAAGLKMAIDIQPDNSGGTGSPPPPPPPQPPMALPPSTPPPETVVPTNQANLFVVGEADFGWRPPVGKSLQFYNDWADAYSPFFVVTDFLGFDYDKSVHNVLVLDKAAYDTCNTTATTQTFSTGNDIFAPDAPGFFYFASGGPGDCAGGMRFQVQYVAGKRPGAPAPEAPGGGGGGGGPAPEQTPPPPPPPPSPGSSPRASAPPAPSPALPPVPPLAPTLERSSPPPPVLTALAPAPSSALLGPGVGTLPVLAALGFSIFLLG